MRSTGSMKRYFTSAVEPGVGDFHCGSVFHYMSLPDSGWVIVMVDGGFDPDPDWNELPHLADPNRPPAYFDGIQHVLGTASGGTPVVANAMTQSVATPAVSAQVTAVNPQSVLSSPVNASGHDPLAGITVAHTTFEIAKKLATINRHFHP